MAQEPYEYKIELPEASMAGVFADFASIWHTENVFVLDFVAVTGPPSRDQDSVPLVPGRVVSRIRIAPAQVFEVARALAQQLEAWETETGRKTAGPMFGDAPGHQS
ncbi:DUF3467 domain-containing protein [Arthrobacter bambusae]|uniref:DUF3467 domain-containing protein n=1 Tax=Arthrobacter bambusae TaxID=1338426 RepID=A0AAW8D8Q7_9MICC|nr:DUF3467 domain-containing protein [Arthrobacter bambusae]MDP9904657.1 hypothetical protein [Arthrobacter bambusae]MDQ0129473.1 hypothetical protein [Arthrobacter bambusae]MDQ0180914.1 hypothetical protein [Arthrobacter bambusae]